ncbi:tyrosine--tRNA ligase [Patescibacteria group bacterium]|nr:tyrosine--tRNA ligase [Patescibacteria group bacterium]MBU1705241.1 tyrosine--tRNA ligase [Patescibacteria group bacterium]
MKTKTDDKKIEALLTRGVEKVYPSAGWLKKELKKGKQLTLYLGIDPTGPTLHLGHAIVLKKMREFQDLGHKLILLIGDFTGMIGDPTDKTATRQSLTREQVLKNAEHYQAQASKFISFSGANKAELKYNSQWFDRMSMREVVELSANFSVQRLLERDMFQKRMTEGKTIHLHEFIYPLLQAYDSVVMEVDGEVGGNDQTFNMLTGRDLMKKMKEREKFVLTTKLLVDPTGKKMGKSEGNMITLADSAQEMFGKVMSWPDELIVRGFELLTDAPEKEIKEIEKGMKSGKVNPRDAKARLAYQVANFYHGAKEADKAQDDFAKMFKQKETPDDVKEYKIKGKQQNILEILVESKLAASKTEARRLIDGGGVKANGHAIEGYDVEIIPGKKGVLIQKGKRHFIKVI